MSVFRSVRKSIWATITRNAFGKFWDNWHCWTSLCMISSNACLLRVLQAINQSIKTLSHSTISWSEWQGDIAATCWQFVVQQRIIYVQWTRHEPHCLGLRIKCSHRNVPLIWTCNMASAAAAAAAGWVEKMLATERTCWMLITGHWLTDRSTAVNKADNRQ